MTDLSMNPYSATSALISIMPDLKLLNEKAYHEEYKKSKAIEVISIAMKAAMISGKQHKIPSISQKYYSRVIGEFMHCNNLDCIINLAEKKIQNGKNLEEGNYNNGRIY